MAISRLSRSLARPDTGTPFLLAMVARYAMSYDTRGRKIGMTDPNMGSWSYLYNALGELIRQTDAKGQVGTLTYDVLGRMLTRNEPDLNSTWATTTAAPPASANSVALPQATNTPARDELFQSGHGQ